MVVIELGMLTEVSWLKPNAAAPIVVTESAMVTEVRPAAQNALLPTPVTVNVVPLSTS